MIDTQSLAWEIRQTIMDASSNSARSKQKAIGPSEVGSECTRKLGYKLLSIPQLNSSDPWLANIGTAVHAYLADIYANKNLEYESPRYLIEHRVDVAENLAGSVDLFDTHTGLVNDWKIVGESSLAKYKKEMRLQYRMQAHLYGFGLLRAGFDVQDVAITFLPRGKSLREMYIWSEPFDFQIAAQGINRLADLVELIEAGGDETLSSLPTVADNCHFCPWYLPASTEVLTGCPGGDIQPKERR